jgi:hypothetical protein
MTLVREAAFEFGVNDFEPFSIIPPINHEEFEVFEQTVLAVTTRLKFRAARRIRGELLQPTTAERETIKFRIRQLRDEIEAADISQSKKNALFSKLDELGEEFEGARVNKAKVLVILTMVATLVSQVQGVLVKAPETVVSIMDSISMVIGKEEDRRLLLERYRKPLAIEDKSDSEKRNAPSSTLEVDRRLGSDADDEIPF